MHQNIYYCIVFKELVGKQMQLTVRTLCDSGDGGPNTFGFDDRFPSSWQYYWSASEFRHTSEVRHLP